MKETNLGEFQEIILLIILSLSNNAYGAEIQREINSELDRSISRGSLHTALTRLEEKGFLVTEVGGATSERGGRRKKFYTVTNTGKESLREAKELRDRLWEQVPNLAFKNI